MTLAIVARCAATGCHGVAIASSSPAVAARCAHARPGIGAVASQNITDPRLGSRLLALLAEGHDATSALAALRATTAHLEYRQLLAIGRQGPGAAYSGAHTLGTSAGAHAEHAACGGNLLADAAVPAAMLEAFGNARGSLPDRLLAALQGGMEAGGEAGPVHSAGLLAVRPGLAWPLVDLRVDWHARCPVPELASLWYLYAPQMDDYVQRALDPAAAPAFGVPGDP